MSFSVATDVHCDTPTCNNWVRGVMDIIAKKAAAQAVAVKAGWHFKRGRASCPDCVRRGLHLVQFVEDDNAGEPGNPN